MRGRLLLILSVAMLLTGCSICFGLQPDPDFPPDVAVEPLRGPGGYLAWHKLLLVTVCFLVWVRLTDWINRDSQLFGKDIDLWPEVWNPISLGSFLLGFWAAVSIPIFWVGFPLMLLLAFGPFTIYFLIRRAKIIETPTLKNKLSTDPSIAAALPQDDGVAIKFTPAGHGKEDQQKNLIRARLAPSFTEMKKLVHEGVRKRAEVLMLDYTRDRVNAQLLIDGAWHPLTPLTREVGDSMLISLKSLAGLNQADRKSRQQGQIGAAVADQKMTLDLTTQGVKTGERVQLKFIQKRKFDLTLSELGMWPDMIGTLVEYSAKPGLLLVSAPPRNGLTTTWRAVLGAVDRITRDWVGIIDEQDFETEVENVVLHRYNKQAGQTPTTIMRRVLLSQPDALALSEVPDSQTLDSIVGDAMEQGRSVVTRVQAGSAAEALFRLFSLAGEKSPFAHTINCVIGQRMARRLCDKCKVAVQVQPQIIQKLGGNPGPTNTLYNAYHLPPIEQRVDEHGKPVEMFPCKVCNDIGYIGRISIFEMIQVTPEIRELMLKQPNMEAIRQLATKNGDLPMLQQGYRLVLMGITTISEVQRVMKS